MIKNITIDDSCSFNGTYVGVITYKVSGNATIHNVHVNAVVDANVIGSGFIGVADNVNDIFIEMKECEN